MSDAQETISGSQIAEALFAVAEGLKAIAAAHHEVAVALRRLGPGAGTPATGSGGRGWNGNSRGGNAGNGGAGGGRHVSGKRFSFTVKRFGSSWKNKPGMFYQGNVEIDGVSYPCSLGVSDKLGVRLAPGQRVTVAGTEPEKRFYNGEEYLSILAIKIEFPDDAAPEVEADGAGTDTDGNEENYPF